ncbi:hypothetical protein B0H10DRAFT_1945141 [Mycena sp. CBHHK59/15]|nr:hypothetical protein B0H10DRAFT_1945141 [Mycena sp. CBHHK59/15]
MLFEYASAYAQPSPVTGQRHANHLPPSAPPMWGTCERGLAPCALAPLRVSINAIRVLLFTQVWDATATAYLSAYRPRRLTAATSAPPIGSCKRRLAGARRKFPYVVSGITRASTFRPTACMRERGNLDCVQHDVRMPGELFAEERTKPECRPSRIFSENEKIGVKLPDAETG